MSVGSGPEGMKFDYPGPQGGLGGRKGASWSLRVATSPPASPKWRHCGELKKLEFQGLGALKKRARNSVSAPKRPGLSRGWHPSELITGNYTFLVILGLGFLSRPSRSKWEFGNKILMDKEISSTGCPHDFWNQKFKYFAGEKSYSPDFCMWKFWSETGFQLNQKPRNKSIFDWFLKASK